MKKIHIIALILIAVSIGVIIAFTNDYTTYETFANAQLQQGKEFHVVGELVKEREMTYDPKNDPNFFSFYLRDIEGTEQKVIYRSAKPQDFERSEQIVIVGQSKGDDFHASKILMKCPSKYVDDELELIEANAPY